MRKRGRCFNIFDIRGGGGRGGGGGLSYRINFLCPAFVFRSGMSNAICNLVLYLQSEGLTI